MNLDSNPVPKKINPCPIADSIVELRFDSNLTSEAILATTYGEFKERFPNIVTLPIMELPAYVRDTDPNLKFSPHYRLTNNDFVIQLGPKCFSVGCPKEYKGWDKYFEQIKWTLEVLKKLNIMSKPLRLGVRYINFFEDCDIFKKIKINLTLANNSLLSYQNVLRTEFDIDNFHCVVQLTNIAMLSGKNTKGSSIDIDVICEEKLNDITCFEDIIISAHELEKKLFFSILQDDFLKQFNPEY